MADIRNYKCGWLSVDQARAINSDFGTMSRFIQGMPKAELHLHIEGSFEPEQILEMGKKNKMLDKLDGYTGDDKAWCDLQKKKRNFGNLQEFLDLYYAGCDVLQTEEDFYSLAWSYLQKASAANVLHAEIFFDPQTHTTERNKHPVSIVINGLHRACADAKTKLSPPVDAHLIMCFLRHRHPGCGYCQPPAGDDDALQCLEDVLASGLKDKLLGVGLDSGEEGNPPTLFKAAFERAGKEGLRRVAHAGEEGPASWITDALDVLGVERVDHGVRCLEQDAVVERLATNKIPLTVCPCSNHRLQVVSRFFAGENPVRRLMDKGLMVTLNGDDPAYFFGHKDRYGMEHGGYVISNYLVVARECALTADELVKLACNSFNASFITAEEKTAYCAKVQQYCEGFA